ncbi:uncharacterized protein PADG_11129 [Paracoccidioides brasiliensis Pb18]|uniref:Uncharacterized protein n=1 Tax=Paracoccidioides brasiliensis (strain Pb18) TaxID=502780 RepID=A0A0A0HWB6_PARBD|nr:uncharacterized protein PADG_11129 [Paracoccidioides brasiliensis Pb18]KGM92673.1 hypothetical protein PADG_11129 [Paracoccidioides brasiliensis Pb18]
MAVWSISTHEAMKMSAERDLLQGIIIDFIALSYVADVVGAAQEFCKVTSVIGIQEQQSWKPRRNAVRARTDSQSGVRGQRHQIRTTTWESHQLTSPNKVPLKPSNNPPSSQYYYFLFAGLAHLQCHDVSCSWVPH